MTAEPSLYRSASCLRVADLQAAITGYVDGMGFELKGTWGDPPGFAIVGRDRVTVMLKRVEAAEVPAPAADGTLDVYLYCADAEGLYAELAQRGAEVVCEPEDQPYGCREFFVRAPGGYLLAFGQDLN